LRQTRRARQALLSAAVECVDAPLVELDRHSAQAGDAVDQEERPGRLDDSADLLDRIGDAGRGLRVYHGDQTIIGPGQLVLDGGHVHRGAPVEIERRHLRSLALGHFGHARAEVTVDQN
jgi:hypothetical protein